MWNVDIKVKATKLWGVTWENNLPFGLQFDCKLQSSQKNWQHSVHAILTGFLVCVVHFSLGWYLCESRCSWIDMVLCLVALNIWWNSSCFWRWTHRKTLPLFISYRWKATKKIDFAIEGDSRLHKKACYGLCPVGLQQFLPTFPKQTNSHIACLFTKYLYVKGSPMLYTTWRWTTQNFCSHTTQ